jgi:hypothetical protein
MNIYFEDWSQPIFLDQLDQKGLPHAGRIIKAYAAAEDPRLAFNDTGIVTLNVNGEAFDADETYEYPGRGVYTGTELETTLAGYGLRNGGDHVARALFRFSNQGGFCQAAMAVERDGDWLIDHPFRGIDGLESARREPVDEKDIHLDIFFPESLRKLREIVDYDDQRMVMGIREGMRWRRSQFGQEA